MASRAANLPRARSRNGLTRALRSSAASRRDRRFWSAPRWAPGSRCAWSQELQQGRDRRPHRRPRAARPGAGFHRRTDRAGPDRCAEAATSPTRATSRKHPNIPPEPNIYTRALIEDGRQNRVMTGPIDTHCPVHILQGMADPDVPHEPCAEACQPAARRRHHPVADPRWRPPAVAAAGSGHDASRGRGVIEQAG